MVTKQQRKGDWIETYTGIHFYVLDPKPEDIDIRDITHALSNICRFNGHTRFHYSVAQHCLNCADYANRIFMDEHIQKYALLHDASEAYICDVSRPIKPLLREYSQIEYDLQSAIYIKFGLPYPQESVLEALTQVDNEVLMIEAKALMCEASWAEEVPAHGLHILRMRPEEAAAEFEKLFRKLFLNMRNYKH